MIYIRSVPARHMLEWKGNNMLKRIIMIGLMAMLLGAANPAMAALQTLTILGGNGVQGDLDPYTEYSLDNGATWRQAYLTGGDGINNPLGCGHPWGLLTDTSCWISQSPDNTVGTGTLAQHSFTLYRVRFNVPAGAINPTATIQIKADNAADVSLNGTSVGHFVGNAASSTTADLAFAGAVHAGLNEFTVNLEDWGGITGFNYRVDLTMDSPSPLTVAPASSATITYPDFCDLTNMTLSGTTATLGNPVNYGGQCVLRLTNNLSQAGGGFVSSPVSLANNASFSTAFSFQITNPVGISDGDGQGADGLVFVVQTQSNQYGGSGGGIGYSGIPKSVGVEFDTWNNGTIDGNNGNHIGIDLNGDLNSAARQNIATRMNNGAVWYAWVDYDGANTLLEVRLSQTPTRPAAATLSYTVDLPATLGQNNAYIGFTSGTGSAGGTHDIRGWQFVSSFAPITSVPSPNQPPVANAGAAQTAQCSGNSSATVALDGTGSTDPDSDPLTYSWTWAGGGSATGSNPSASFPLGTTTVTLTVDDGQGHTDSATTTVTVEDTTAPTVNAGADVTIEATSTSGANYDVGAQSTATDTCCPVTPTVSPAGPYALGSTTVTVSATDCSNNTGSDSMVVKVQDTTPPVITAPANVSVEANAVSSTVSIGTATATDIFPVTITSNAPATYPLGSTTVTWTATDANGNSSTATQTVTVHDTTPPALTPPGNLTVEANAVNSTVSIGTATATDIFPVTITDRKSTRLNSSHEIPSRMPSSA